MEIQILRTIGEIGLNFPIGPSKQAYYLTKGLANKKIKNIVLTFKSQGLNNEDYIKVKEFKPLIKAGHYKISFKMIKEIFKEEFNIVHVHGYRNFQTDLGAFVSYFKKKPLVITTHGTVLGYKYGYISKIWQNEVYDILTQKKVLNIAKAIVATSFFEAKELINFSIPKNKIHIIPNCIDIPRNYKKEHKNKEKIVILTVSRLTFKNNLELALKIFSKAVRKNNKLRYIIIGEEKPSRYSIEEKNYKQKLLKVCKELKIENYVNFLGWVTGNELWEIYREADIYLWTSRYDNFGHSLAEAAFFGLPIISTPVGIAPELINKNEGGYLILNEEETVKNLIELSENFKLRKIMGENNIFKSEQYSIKNMVNKYIILYNKLLN